MPAQTTTPVIFSDEDDRLVFYTPAAPLEELNPFLLRYSYLYRVWIAMHLGERTPTGVHADVERGLERSLLALRRLAGQRGSRLTVLAFPYLRPFEDWRPAKQERYLRLLAMLERLGIEHHDLRIPIEEALAAGVDIWEKPGDALHPSAQLGLRIGRYLVQAGFAP